MNNTKQSITIYHSPDADDAFMFYGIVCGAIAHPDFRFEHELCDIETLNHRAVRGEVDVTAISVHAYPYLRGQYSVLRCGASMGEENYGPRIVAREPLNFAKGEAHVIAVPGDLTSTTLALRMYLKQHRIEAELVVMPFDHVQEAVKSGDVDAGAIIHEGQITHQREGLFTVLDLGAWWWQREALPLPLGVNVVKRSLGNAVALAVKDVLKRSIEHALANRDDALTYALSYGRGLSRADADTFVGMYVNHRTLDLGQAGEESICKFLAQAEEQKLIPSGQAPEFI